MWYLEIMLGLLEKLPKNKRKDGEYFLRELFSSIQKVDRQPALEFFLGLIDKSYWKFERQDPKSVTLAEFSRYILGLSLLYIKANNDVAIWNSDFISHLDNITPFLEQDKKEKSLITLLNQLEINVFISLDYKVCLDFTHLSTLLQHAKLETTRNFVSSCDNLDDSEASDGFLMLVQEAKQILTAAAPEHVTFKGILSRFSLLMSKNKNHRSEQFAPEHIAKENIASGHQ